MRAKQGVGFPCNSSRVSRARGSIECEGVGNRQAHVEVVRRRFEDVAAAVIGASGNDRLPLALPGVRRLDGLSEDRFHGRSHAVADEEDSGGKARGRGAGGEWWFDVVPQG